MGRTAAVTYEQVAAAAEELRASGRTPAAKLIRHMLGDVGSLGTIQKHLIEWQSRQGDIQPATRILAPELQRAVFKFVDEEVSRINSELRQELDNCKRAAVDLAVDNERQAEFVRVLQAELAVQATAKTEQDGRLARLLDELGTARNETSCERREAELARVELAKVQARLEAMASLESELRQLRADLDVQRQACVRAEQNAAVLAAQKAGLEARVAELKDAAPAQSHVNGASVEEHASRKADRPPRTSARRGEKAEGSGETSVPQPGHTSNSATSGDAQPGEPRQSKLC